MARGKCPKCEKVLTYVNVDDPDIKAGIGGSTWRGAAYLCPYCQTILSVQIDPIAIKTDVVKEVVKKLKGGN